MTIRVTQTNAEAFISPDDVAARVTQVAVEAWVTPITAARVTFVGFEAWVSDAYVDPCGNPWELPTVADYPLPPTGPYPLFFHEDVPEFRTYGNEFADLRQEHAVNAQKIRRFTFTYDGLSPAEAAILDAHYESAKGEAFGFTVTLPRTLEVVQNVRYAPDGFKINEHEKAWSLPRTVTLIRYP